MCEKYPSEPTPRHCAPPQGRWGYGTSWPLRVPKPQRVEGRALRVRAVLGSERDGVGKGREKSRIPSTPTRRARAGTSPSPTWKQGGAGWAGGNGRRVPRPLPSPAARGAWGTWGGDPRAPGRGAAAVTAGSAGAGAARRGPGRRCGRRAGRGRAARGASFLAGKGAIVCSYSWYSGGHEPRGRRFQRPRERAGGLAGAGGRDAGAGAHPLGVELRCRRAARAGAGPGPGPPGSPWHPLAPTG